MKEKKKLSAGAIVLIIFGAIILTAAAVLLILFLRFKSMMANMELTIDDIPAYISAEPMPVSERLSFDTDGNMGIRLDKRDIWWYLQKDFDTDIEADLAESFEDIGIEGLIYSGIGLTIDDGKLTIDVEAYYKKIRLAFRLFGKLSYDGTDVIADLTGAEILGKQVSVEKFAGFAGIDTSKLCRTFTPEYTFISSADKVVFDDDCVTFTGPMSTDVLYNTDIDMTRRYLMSVTQEKCNLVGPVFIDSGDGSDRSPATCYATLLPVISADPEVYMEYLDQLFTLISSTGISKLELIAKNYGFSDRWLGVIDGAEYSARSTALYDEYYVAYRFSKSVFYRMIDEYSAGKLRIASGQFTYNKQPFDPETFYGDEYPYYSVMFNLPEMKLCLFTMDGWTDDCTSYPRISSILDSTSSISGEFTNSARYTPGMVLPGKDGRTYMIYDDEPGMLIIPVELKFPENAVPLFRIGTEDGRIYTAK